MTVLPSVHAGTVAKSAQGAVSLTPRSSRTILVIVVAASIAISVHSVAPEAAARAGADLTHLLRFMAALKGAMALAAFAAVLWRFGEPVTSGRLGAYALVSGIMAAGPPLIWGIDRVGLGALLLHGGLLACVVLLWRDPATSARLRRAVAARSQRC